jgi:hypothetical protein
MNDAQVETVVLGAIACVALICLAAICIAGMRS